MHPLTFQLSRALVIVEFSRAVGYCMIVRTRDDSLLPPRYSCCTTHFPTTILADTCCDAVVGTSSVEFAVGYCVIVRTRDDYYLLNLGHLGIAAVLPTFQSRMSSNLPRSDHTYTLRSFCSWSSSEDPGERPEPKHHSPLHLWRVMPPEAFVTTDVSYPHTAHV